LFSVFLSSSCPACSITRLTLRTCPPEIPPLTLLSAGHGVGRAAAHYKSGIRWSLMLLTRYPCGMLFLRKKTAIGPWQQVVSKGHQVTSVYSRTRRLTNL
jgi:hypothetical protein